jgi:ATP-dependent DNA helicase 2 subunit 1
LNVIYRTDEEDETFDSRTDASVQFSELRSLVKAKQTPRRAQFDIEMEIGPGFSIGIKGYILVKRLEAKPSFWVYKRDDQPVLVESESTTVCEATSAPLKPEDIKKSYTFGGENILFSQEEFNQMRSFGNPGKLIPCVNEKKRMLTIS